MRHSLWSLPLLLPAALAAILWIEPAPASAQTIAILDPFDLPAIDRTKWRGNESATSLAIVSTESTRAIAAGQLRLALTTHGVDGSGTGGEARNRVLLNHPALVDGTPAITAVRSVVTITKAVAANCADAASATLTQAGMMSFFFNSGGGTSHPSDLTGDVLATIDMRRDSRLGRTINATVARCTNAGCSSADIVKAAVFAKRWQIGEAVTLTMRWQPDQNRFRFTAASAAGSEAKVVDYELADDMRAKAFLADLRVSNAIPACAAGPVTAKIDARFDDAALNANAVAAIGQ
jgi:hypothetical protein